jgi:hypothetical protein
LDYILGELTAINDLTFSDVVGIYASIKIAFDKNYQCDKCRKRFAKSFRNQRKSCSLGKTLTHEWNGLKFYRCLGSFFNPGHFIINDLYRHYRNGILPFSGGLFDQPNKIIEALHLAESIAVQEEEKQWQKTKSK